MPNEIDSIIDAIQQTAAHEVGHAMYALLGGIPDVQFDIQIKKMGISGPWEVRGTHYHRGFDEEIDRAAQGLAGVTAQELFLHPELNDAELYERVIKHASLSDSDREHFDLLSEEKKKASFAESAKVIRQILPRIGRMVNIVSEQLNAQPDPGAASAGFHYSWKGQQLALEVVAIKKDLFEPDPKSE